MLMGSPQHGQWPAWPGQVGARKDLPGEQAQHLPRGDGWRDDQESQQPGLVQRLSHVGEQVNEAPAEERRMGHPPPNLACMAPDPRATGGGAERGRHLWTLLDSSQAEMRKEPVTLGCCRQGCPTPRARGQLY